MFNFILSLFAVLCAVFAPVRRFAVALSTAVFGVSLSASALAQLHEVETVLGTVSFSEAGAVAIPVDTTITSGVGIWFALFAIGVVIALLMRLVRFRRG